MFASILLPAQMPTMLSALSGAAGPVAEHLEKFAVTNHELRQYELDGTVGQNMQTMAYIRGVGGSVGT
jgi:tetrahydromethanopterin S-methyltransferase subunit D